MCFIKQKAIVFKHEYNRLYCDFLKEKSKEFKIYFCIVILLIITGSTGTSATPFSRVVVLT